MNKVYLEKVFSTERMAKYFAAHPGNEAKAIAHYQCNVAISEAFYPCISAIEVALRNSINRELATKFGVTNWYSHFPTTPGLAKLVKDVTIAQSQITKRKELVTPSKIVAELTMGFWVRLFNAEFERILWKDLRRAFPYLPKAQKHRRRVSGPLNGFWNFRNRVFHNEPICWSFTRLHEIHDEMIQTLQWINKDLPVWLAQIDRFDATLSEIKERLK